MKTHPKNVIKYCLRCGSEKFYTHNEGRSFKCEECGFAYFINSSAAVACLILDNEGRLLLCTRAVEPGIGMLDLPGGFVDPNETAEQAVKREIKEELGVDVTWMEYLVSFPNEYPFSGFSVFTLDLAFLCKIDPYDAITPQDDVADFRFIFPDEIDMNELYSDSMRNIINYYKSKYWK